MSAGQFQLGPSSLTDALYESVRSRIISGDIAPGEKLTEQRIADDYRVARPTAKACLERLTALGLLRRSAHKTAVVPELDEVDITDLFFTREMFECTAADRLAQARTVPEAARKAQTAIESAVRAKAFDDQVVADIEFHWALINAVDSPRLSRVYEMVSGEVHLTMGQFKAHRRTTPSTVAAEHALILKAIEDGDRAAAREQMAHHLQQARDRVLAQVVASREEAPA
ncbi:GntR family transcriptional regulator [Occultella kanbiaonis]|uniref:GntR family transcriptional regulator n=1 Tax=Occultella kanbiaonis TaxID=2675754 RepID=UPI0012B6DD51|nr:GntR family transcriptional regulator [Occultella kanbiaonis]